MKRWSKVLAMLLGAVLVMAGTRSATASIAPKWSDEQLVDFSAVVVSGQVSSVASGWDANAIYTYITLDVDDVLKGDIAERQIVLKQAGGVVDDIGLEVSSQARFRLGERVVVFLEVRPRDGTLYTTALWQGKWTVEIDAATGRRIAVRSDPSTPNGEIDRRDLSLFSESVSVRSAQVSRAETFTAVPAETPVSNGSNPFATLDSPARWITQPVTVDLQAGGQPGLPGGGLSQIQNGLGQWNAAGAAFSWSLRSTSAAQRCGTVFGSSGILTVVWNDPCAETSNAGGTLAVAWTWFTTATAGGTINGVPFRQMLEVVIITNDSANAQQFILNSNCFQQVLLHEIGHALGMGHTSDSSAVMFATVAFSQCSAAALPLQPDDISGIRFIYPGGGGTTTPPSSAPGNVQVVVNGTTSITVSWNAVTAIEVEGYFAAATSYRLDFRATPTGPVITPVPATGTSITVQIPPGISGTFYVSVTGINSGGAGPSSAPVAFTIGGGPGPCTAAPPTPTGVSGGIVSGTATVQWNASPGATSYIVQAGLTQGSSNLFNQNIGSLTAVSASGLPAGFRAFVRIIAVNACGQSAPTPDFTLQ